MTIKINLKNYLAHKDKNKYEQACFIISNIVENHITKMITKGATKEEVFAVRRAYKTLVHNYDVEWLND